MMRRIILVLISVIYFPGLALGAILEENCRSNYSSKDINIQLDSTGISGWRFLNPRAPFAVVDFKSRLKNRSLIC